MFEDAPSSFANCVTTALIDRNKINAQIKPTKPGIAPLVELSVPYSLKNYASTVEGDPKIPLELFWENGELALTGEIKIGTSAKPKQIYAHRSGKHISLILKGLLGELKEPLEIGYVRSLDPLPPRLKKIAVHKSAPLKETMPLACQESNNIYFDTLFLYLGSIEARFEKHMSQESAWIELTNGFMRLTKSSIPEINFSNWKTKREQRYDHIAEFEKALGAALESNSIASHNPLDEFYATSRQIQ
jgi:D-alanyl-D-alanine carboxypeptidase